MNDIAYCHIVERLIFLTNTQIDALCAIRIINKIFIH